MMKKYTLAVFTTAIILISSLSSIAQINGGPLNYDGSNDYVSLGNPLSMQFAGTNEFFVELWSNPLNTSGGLHMVTNKPLWNYGVVNYGSDNETGGNNAVISHKGKTISIDNKVITAHFSQDNCSDNINKGNINYKSYSSKKTYNHNSSGNGIAEATGDAIKVYPNPAESIFNVAIPAVYKNVEIQLSDITGRIMDNRIISDNDGAPMEFNLSNVASGIYMVKLTIDKGTYLVKLIHK